MDSLANLLANNLNSPENTALVRRLTALESRLDSISRQRGPTVAAARATAASPAGQAPHLPGPSPATRSNRIARQYSVTVEDIQRWNPQIGAGDKIAVGQELVIVASTS